MTKLFKQTIFSRFKFKFKLSNSKKELYYLLSDINQLEIMV